MVASVSSSNCLLYMKIPIWIWIGDASLEGLQFTCVDPPLMASLIGNSSICRLGSDCAGAGDGEVPVQVPGGTSYCCQTASVDAQMQASPSCTFDG